MPVLTPTKERGAQTRGTATIYTEAAQRMTDKELAGLFPDGGLNAAFIADLMSAALTHERCGRHLYRTVAARSNNPMLVRKYREFGEETEHHAELLEGIITTAGGNPNYVSPMARVVQGMDTKLIESTYALSGGVDLMTAEMAMLHAVFLAESTDHVNWRLLRNVCEQLPDGPVHDELRAAVDTVEAEEDEHLAWATSTKERLVALQVSHPVIAGVTEKAEETVARIANWFTDNGPDQGMTRRNCGGNRHLHNHL